MKQLSVSEQLLYSTIQIVCYSNNRTVKSTGTGFIYGCCVSKEGCCPVLITNKHVVEDAEDCELIFHIKDVDGNPSPEKYKYEIKNDFKSQCVYHPNPDIDLAMYNLSLAFEICRRNGKNVFYSYLSKHLIPSESDINDLSAIEDIIMIGYPNGIIDSKNNLPIVRKGITATPYFVDYNGNKHFLADIACYPGSSGSPILILQEGFSKNKFGSMSIGKSKVHLLGINSSVFLNPVTGNIITQNTVDYKALMGVPNNLAIIIKAENLSFFEKFVESHIEK